MDVLALTVRASIITVARVNMNRFIVVFFFSYTFDYLLFEEGVHFLFSDTKIRWIL